MLPVLAGVTALACWHVVQAALVRMLDLRLPRQILVDTLEHSGSSLQIGMISLLAVVLAPVSEELLFRGVLYLPVRSRIGSVGAGLVVSVLFAAVHWNLAGLVHLFILALLLTALLEATGSMIVPILVHSVHNCASLAIILVTRSALT